MHEPNKLTALIISNCADVLTFALSREAALEIQKQFLPHPIVDELLFRLPEQKADRALLEVGALLRALDDIDDVKPMLAAMLDPSYGRVRREKRPLEDLHFRDMTNKILHARGFQWGVDEKHGVTVKCIGGNPQRWLEADIWLDRLVSLCSNLAARL